MRKPTACTQCRRVKLACDGARPCQRCISRDRVALCTSQSHNAALQGRKDGSDSQVKSGNRSSILPTSDKLSWSLYDISKPEVNRGGNAEKGDANNTIASMETAKSTKNTTVTDTATGEIVFIGQHASILCFQSLLPDSPRLSISTNAILSAFLLRNESTLHPFGTLWRPGFDLTDVCEALPESRLCLKYFEAYREASRHYLPRCIDFDDFEQRMCFILQRRNEIGLDAAIDQSFGGGSVGRNAWCGLWFAVLAAGCQWSGSSSSLLLSSEQDVTIKVFVACAFECLRRSQIYACDSLEILQTRLLIEAVICNAGNPGLALNLLGSTWRQAYAIGLSAPESSLGPLANSLWHSIVELDAAISYAYGRVPLAALTCRNRIRQSTYDDKLASPFTSSEEAGKRLHCLRMDFQNADWPNLSSDAKIEYLNATLSKAETLISLTSDLSATTATEIKDIEVFKIMALQFKADLHRLFCVTENTGSARQMYNFEEAKVHYHQVLLSFDRLVRFEKLGRLSWTIRQSVTSSALVLAALDRASSSSNYKHIVHKTISTLEGVPILTNELTTGLRGNASATPTFKHALTMVWALYEDI